MFNLFLVLFLLQRESRKMAISFRTGPLILFVWYACIGIEELTLILVFTLLLLGCCLLTCLIA